MSERRLTKRGNDDKVYLTGYTPEYLAIKKLCDYEDLQEQNRLIILPCKVGDTLYCLDFRNIPNDEIYEARITSFIIGTGRETVTFRFDNPTSQYEELHNWNGGMCRIDEIGEKYYFLTRAEAESALREVQGSE